MLRLFPRPMSWMIAILPAALATAPVLAAPGLNELDFLNTHGTEAAWSTLTGIQSPQDTTRPSGPPRLNEPAPPGPPGPPSTPAAPGAPAPASTAGVATVVQPEPEPAYIFGAGYLHQFNAEIDSNAFMAVDRFYASFTARVYTADDFKLTMLMGYEFDAYQWKGVSTLGSGQPFNSVNLFALQIRGTFKLSSYWSASVGGVFGIAGETDADVGESLYGGGIASVAWTPQSNLMLGFGILAVTQIEDDVLIVPLPIIHWRFAEEWVLSTVRRPPASPFVGLDLAWEPVGSPVDVSLGVAWQDRRFRLARNPTAFLNKGVGEDQSFAVLMSVGYDITKSARLDLAAGVNVYEELIVADSLGQRERKATLDPSGMLGLFFTLKF